ncbi:DUF2382 domain-containing protein [Pseudarthrobacter sp. alpha12b]
MSSFTDRILTSRSAGQPCRVWSAGVPVERVRLDTDVVRDEETVSEEVRKEHIDTNGIDDTRR